MTLKYYRVFYRKSYRSDERSGEYEEKDICIKDEFGNMVRVVELLNEFAIIDAADIIRVEDA